MKVLVLNCGSSSVKYQLLDMQNERALAWGRVERIGGDDAILSHRTADPLDQPGVEHKETGTILEHSQAVRTALGAMTHPAHGVIKNLAEIRAVGHRVVHGGEAFSASVLVTPAVKAEIRRCAELAPLHNLPNLAGIEAAEAVLPDVPGVAVFDTAFHATMPRHAYLYALPRVLYRRHGVRRYGFHGTSHRFVARRLAACLDRSVEELKLITCHLGNGCSICAIDGGRSVDTSMGFTPLEGLVMGTRSGDVDPGVLPYIMAREDLSAFEVSSMLNKHSGLLGVSGLSGDMRDVEEEMQAGDPRAGEAFAIFTYRMRKYIGAYAAALGGVDGIAFTAGIGENSWRVREAILSPLGILGVRFDAGANRGARQEKRLTAPGSPVEAWVIPTNEELEIARDTVRVVQEA